MPHRRLHADAVLDDAREAVRRFLAASDPTEKRILYAAAVGLIRTVPDALYKVDSPNDPDLEARRAAWWPNAKKDAIFVDFIKDERDRVWHRYKPKGRADALLISAAGDRLLLGPEGGHLLTGTWSIEGGPYDCRDVADLLQEALEWCQQRLDSLRA